MSGTSSSGDPAAKRQKPGEKKSLRDLHAKEFMSYTKLFRGPEVIVSAGGQDFELPKALLCYSSPFFDKAFNGNFKEGSEQKLSMTACSAEVFEMIVQWMYTSQVILPPVKASAQQNVNANSSSVKEVERPGPERLSMLLAFLMLTDQIDLLGPFDSVIASVTDILKSSDTALQSEHIRSVAQMPCGHGLRKLVAQSCIKAYIESTGTPTTRACGQIPATFRFKKEMAELDSFAADLFKEFDEVFRKRVSGRNSTYHVFDPLAQGCPIYF